MRIEELRPWHLAWLEAQPSQKIATLLRDDAVLAHAFCASGPAWAAIGEGRVLACGGLLYRSFGWPYAWSLIGNHVDRRTMVELRRIALDFLDEANRKHRRLETDTFGEREAGWVASLGFEREGVRRSAAPDGCDLQAWARVR